MALITTFCEFIHDIDFNILWGRGCSPLAERVFSVMGFRGAVVASTLVSVKRESLCWCRSPTGSECSGAVVGEEMNTTGRGYSVPLTAICPVQSRIVGPICVGIVR